MLDYPHLEALAALAGTGHFERAARQLHVTQSAISQRIRALESQIGQPVVIRSRPILLTEAGAAILRYFRQIESLRDAVVAELRQGDAGEVQRLAIAVNADTLATWLPDAVDLLLGERNLLLELHIDDQDQTHHMLRNGHVIGCISARAEPAQSCDRVYLGAMEYVPAATEAFLRRYFEGGLTAEAVRHAPAVEFNSRDNLLALYLHRDFALQRGDYSAHQVPSSEGFLEWILRGHAWGLVPKLQAEPYLAEGRLILPKDARSLLIPLYWHVWNMTTPTIRAVSEALMAVAGEKLTGHELG